MFTTDSKQIEHFNNEIEKEIHSYNFDLTLIEDKHKLQNLCESMANEIDFIFEINDEKTVLNLYGFKNTAEVYYNELVKLL